MRRARWGQLEPEKESGGLARRFPFLDQGHWRYSFDVPRCHWPHPDQAVLVVDAAGKLIDELGSGKGVDAGFPARRDLHRDKDNQ